MAESDRPALDPALAPENAARTVRRSRAAEIVAVVTVICGASAGVAACTSSVVHDVAAVRIAEAQRRCP